MIEPHWTDGKATLYHGDCLSVLRELPSESVNCCVTSPPYWCLRDYGVSGQIGLEPTPEAYVAKMVEVFREVRRVLRDDGTLWLNVGDSYAADARDLKPKDLVGIPWMLAFALRSDGWYLRSDVIWAKPNGMPESVKDRPVRSHEYVFLLSKSERYYYDYESVRLPPLPSTTKRLAQHIESQSGSVRANGGGKTNGTMKAVQRKSDKQRGHSRRHDGFNDRWDAMTKEEQQSSGAALRDVWWLSPAQTKDSHFAVMPESLARLCILAGCPQDGVVLDPFAGSGTTLYVARDQGCKSIGIELNGDYCELVKRRLQQRALI